MQFKGFFLSGGLAALLFSGAEPIYAILFCEIILKLGQWFRRCRLKYFLSGALVTLLIGAAGPLLQF